MFASIGKAFAKVFAAIGHYGLQAARWASDHPDVTAAVEAAAGAASPQAAVAIHVAESAQSIVKAVQDARAGKVSDQETVDTVASHAQDIVDIVHAAKS